MSAWCTETKTFSYVVVGYVSSFITFIIYKQTRHYSLRRFGNVAYTLPPNTARTPYQSFSLYLPPSAR